MDYEKNSEIILNIITKYSLNNIIFECLIDV